MSSVSRAVLALAVFVGMSASMAAAQQKSPTAPGHIGQNAEVIGLIAGPAGSVSLRMATDVAAVLDGSDLRILPISGRGPVQSASDLFYLKGIDAAVLPSDALAHVEAKRLPADTGRIRYVTKLYGEEFHLITRRNIAKTADLAGKKVNLGPEHGVSAISGEAVFAGLAIKIEPTSHEFWQALDKLRSGEIDALVHVAPRPVELLASVSPADGLKLLPIVLDGEASRRYPAALLTAADYPGLIDQDAEVETVSVSQVLAVLDWERGGARQDRVRRFVDKFLESFDKLGEARLDRRWRDINLAAEVAGWERDSRATAWLAKVRVAKSKSENEESEALRTAFKRFLRTSGEAAALSNDDQTALFQQFLRWKEAGGQ